MSITTRAASPLQPITRTVNVLLAVTLAGLVLGGVGSLLGQAEFFGFKAGDPPDVCIDTDIFAVHAGPGHLPVQGLGPHDRARVDTMTVCFSHVSAVGRIFGIFTHLPSLLFFMGVMLLIRRTLGAAEANGIYTPATANRIRALGWFLIVGVFVVPVVETLARSGVMASRLPYANWTSGFHLWNDVFPFSIPVLLTGIGLITFARIMRIGAMMRADLEGTV
jgi:hypothetical protein